MHGMRPSRSKAANGHSKLSKPLSCCCEKLLPGCLQGCHRLLSQDRQLQGEEGCNPQSVSHLQPTDSPSQHMPALALRTFPPAGANPLLLKPKQTLRSQITCDTWFIVGAEMDCSLAWPCHLFCGSSQGPTAYPGSSRWRQVSVIYELADCDIST